MGNLREHPGHRSDAANRIRLARLFHETRRDRRAKQVWIAPVTECFHSERQECSEDFDLHHIVTPGHWERA